MAIPVYRHILVSTDGSEISTNAVRESAGLAAALGADLTILTVAPAFACLGERGHAFESMPPDVRRQAWEYLEADAVAALSSAMIIAENAGVKAKTLKADGASTYELIIDTAKSTGADLLVMGSHGRSGLSSVLLGSVTQKVLAHSRLPVLVCR